MAFRKALFLFISSFFAFQSLASSTCETATVAVEGSQSVSTGSISADEDVWWQKPSYNGNLPWTIAIEPIEGGDSCEMPITAALGENQLSDGDSQYKWYSFTMPAYGILFIDSETQNSVSVFTSGCDTSVGLGSGYGAVGVSGIEAGQDVLIRWYTSGFNGFTWNLSIELPAEGEECAQALPASIGSNQIPLANSSYYWYTFTMPSAGKLKINSPFNGRIEVKQGTCEGLTGVHNANGVEVATLSQGDQVFIKIATNVNGGLGGFSWNLSVEEFEPGDLCTVPQAAVLGTNALPASDLITYWYSLTMPEDGKLIVESDYTQFVSLYTSSCDNPLQIGSGIGDAIAANRLAGEQIFIAWLILEDYSAFDWSLTVLPTGPGENCELAVTAESGENSLPPLAAPYYWYSYTMPSAGMLHIDSEQTVQVDVFSADCESPIHLASGRGSLGIADLGSGEEIFLRWHTQSITSGFNWELSIEDFSAGDRCDISMGAAEGVNAIESAVDQWTWYSFTMPRDGTLNLSTESMADVGVYSGTCDNLAYRIIGSSPVTVVDIPAGEQVFVKWKGKFEQGASWSLTIQDYNRGQSCSLPIAATEGTNIDEVGNLQALWYSFTMPRAGKLRLSTQQYQYVDVYSNTCDNLQYEFSGEGSAESADIPEGENLLIYWGTYGLSNDIQWELEILDLVEGDNCEIAFTPLEGVNYIPETTSHYVWYSFEMPSDGKLSILSESNAKVTVYYNTCDALFFLAERYGSISIGDTQAGKQFFVRWETKASGGDFNWSLNIEDFQEGESCAEAKSVVEGENHVPATIINSYWHSFTMPRTGRLEISSDAYVEVLTGNCGSPQSKGGAWGNISLTDFVEGDRVLLKWNTAYNGGDFNFEISVSDLEDGNSCGMAVEAFEGTNQLAASASYHWYRFIMPDDGKLTIETEASASVQIFSNLCSNLSDLAQGYRKVSLSTLDAGAEIYIRWQANIESNFNWQLNVEELTSGDRCSVANTAVEGVNSVPLKASTSYWYMFTMPREGKLVIKSANQNSFKLYRGCHGDGYFNSGRNLLSIQDLAVGETVYLEWELWNESAFDWQLSVEDLGEGDKCELADIAIEGENQLPEADATEYWYRFTMPAEKSLQLSSGSSAFVEVYSGSCPSPVYRGFATGGGGSFGSFASGAEVYIKWWSNGQTFSWNLLLEEPSDGDACENAIGAAFGINSVSESENLFAWYKFTMPEDGKIRYSSSSNDGVTFYLGSCNSLDGVAYGNSYLDVTSLNAGDEVWIRVDTRQSGGGYNFTLELLEIVPGDKCALAFDAVLGNNYVASTESSQVWTQFIMPEAGRLHIEGPTSGFNLYVGGCALQDRMFGGYSQLDMNGLQVGDNIYFEFNTTTAKGDFNYFISVESELAGDACNIPLEAGLGVNIATQQIQWFEYTAPAEGFVTISSRNNSTSYSKLKVYSECGTEPITQAEAFNGTYAKVEELIKGQKILIHWDDFSGMKGYKWHLNFHSTVIKQNQSIIFSEFADLTYGETLPLSATSGSGLPVSFEVVSGKAIITNGSISPTGIGEVVVRATQAGDLYYINPAEPATRSFTVLPAEITVTADDLSMVYGEAIPILTMTLSGLVNEETQAVIKSLPIAQIAETAPLAAGTYEVVPSGGSADNYTFKHLKGKLTVYKAAQSITFASLPDVSVGTSSVQLQASSTSNLPVSFAVSGQAALTGNMVTFTGTGLITVTASQEGDNNYHAAQPVVRTFNIIAEPQYSVSGSLTGANGEPLEGSITASRSGGAVAGTAVLTNGAYTISGLIKDSYYLKYSPSGVFVQTHRTTYYKGAALANQATLIEIVGSSLTSVDWTAIVKETPPAEQGKGTISGNVVAGENGRGVRVVLGRTMVDGTPLEGIIVYLLKASDNSIFKEATTDANGKFVMTGIPSGSYKFHVDVPGIAMDPNNSTIELDENVPLEITAMVNEDGIVAQVVVIKGLEEEQMAVLVFPNPVSDVLNIRFDGEVKNLVLKVFNLLGQEQFQVEITGGLQSIDFSRQPRGIYLLTIQDTKDGRLLRQVKLKKE